jgi:hypothetical protein
MLTLVELAPSRNPETLHGHFFAKDLPFSFIPASHRPVSGAGFLSLSLVKLAQESDLSLAGFVWLPAAGTGPVFEPEHLDLLRAIGAGKDFLYPEGERLRRNLDDCSHYNKV